MTTRFKLSIVGAAAALVVIGALVALLLRAHTTAGERHEAHVAYTNSLAACQRGNRVRLHQYQLAVAIDAYKVITEMRAEPHARHNGTLDCSDPEVVEKP